MYMKYKQEVYFFFSSYDYSIYAQYYNHSIILHSAFLLTLFITQFYVCICIENRKSFYSLQIQIYVGILQSYYWNPEGQVCYGISDFLDFLRVVRCINQTWVLFSGIWGSTHNERVYSVLNTMKQWSTNTHTKWDK